MEHLTRDNFDPALVLEVLRKGGLDGFGESNLRGLLEEACHALARERETKRLFLDLVSTMNKTLSR
jgi:4-hydroxyphenylpyruvate dioxygenase-like putative hemolysin